MRGNVDSSRSGVLNSDEDRKSLSFPHLVPIRLSHDVMPTTGKLFSIQ